jgi:hypothetical protein
MGEGRRGEGEKGRREKEEKAGGQGQEGKKGEKGRPEVLTLSLAGCLSQLPYGNGMCTYAETEFNHYPFSRPNLCQVGRTT